MFFGIPILFAATGPLHFVFEWTRNSAAAGLFTPVNESPWEHLKLTFWPLLIWCLAGYLLFLRKRGGGFTRAAVICAVTGLFCALFITAFFYTYTGALGTESLAVDIASQFFALLFGILLARHIDKHTKPGRFAAFLAVLLILVLAASFIYFTFSTPRLPIFKDPPTGTYGI
jgi:hypothetical protein